MEFFQLLVLSVVVSAAIYFLLPRLNHEASPLRLALLSFVAIYLIMVAWAMTYEIYLDYRLSTFDSNGDGMFSGPEENTLEQARFSAAVTNDLGRNLVPITGLMWSLAYSSMLYVAMLIWRAFR